MDILSSLLLLFEVFGVNAASGIYQEDNQVYIISDNSPYLYHYDIKSTKTNKVLLDSSSRAEIVKKKDKLDLEAICSVGDELVIVGSGSRSNRENAFLYHKKTGKVQKQSLTPLYNALRKASGLDYQDFNIEGVAFKQGLWYFMNRGNGPKNKNLVFSFKGDRNLQIVPQNIEVHSFDLPMVQGCVSGFSDAVLVDDKLYYVATAEDEASTYLDGEVKGSFMGYIDLNKWTLGPIQEIAKEKKIEGLAFFKKSSSVKTFMICEDPDNSKRESTLVYAFDFETK